MQTEKLVQTLLAQTNEMIKQAERLKTYDFNTQNRI